MRAWNLLFNAMTGRRFVAVIALGMTWGCSFAYLDAATVTRRTWIDFKGTLSGTGVYTRDASETDASNTFRGVGAVSIADGVADIKGDETPASGFFLNANNYGLGSLTGQNWIAEALFVPDVPATQQPVDTTGGVGRRNNHILDVQGDTFYRFNGEAIGDEKFTEFGYYDGTNEQKTTITDLPTNRFSHVALVWNSGASSLEAFYDGQSQGVIDQEGFDVSSPYVGFGWFARYLTGTSNVNFGPRSVNGKFDAVAFSTYSGSFVPGFAGGGDFQLDPAQSPNLVLKLQVNTVTGRTTIVNNTSSPVSIQGYEVTSALGSLDDSGWVSLEDQNLNPVMGGDGPGETWQEGGNPSAQGLLEGFLLGQTTLAPGQSLWLGSAYDAAIGAGDVGFRYRLSGVSGLIDGLTEYDNTTPTGIDGDFNGDTKVNAADYTVWRDKLGTSTTLPNDPTPGEVTSVDYLVWRANYGKSLAPGAGAASISGAVPEPGGLLLLLAAIPCLLTRVAYGLGINKSDFAPLLVFTGAKNKGVVDDRAIS